MNAQLDPEIHTELELARQARKSGNEGKARVCARRAAGMALRKFFERSRISAMGKSSYQLIQTFADLPGLDPRLRQSAINLSVKVNESFNLPEEVDLISEANFLCEFLLNGWKYDQFIS